MLRRRALALTLGVVLWTAGCSDGTPEEESVRTSDGVPVQGDEHTLDGTLVVAGAGLLFTKDLGGQGGWQERMTLPAGYAAASVHRAGQELYVAELDALNPMFVSVYDLATFGHKHSFVWPGTEDLWRVRGLAVAPDGRHLAARVEGAGEASLQILDLVTEQVVFASPVGVASNMVWTPELELVFAAVNPAGGEQDHAGIAAVPLSTFLSADGQLKTPLLQTFDQAQWGGRGVQEVALSLDGTQLVYVLRGDIWLASRVPGSAATQLTAGPTRPRGPAFSPDASQVIFVDESPYALNHTLVLPADDSGPHHVDVDAGAISPAVVVLDHDNLVEEVLGWLP